MDDWVSIARILRARGIRGEVAAEILTDFPDRFSKLNRVSVSCQGKRHWEHLEHFWFHKSRVVLKFRGRDRPHQVQDLIGCELQVPEKERVELPEGGFYDSDLLGCQILENGVSRGMVTSLFDTGPVGRNLVVVNSQGREFMIPMAHEFILSVDLQSKEIKVKLPPGLRELSGSEKPKKRRPPGARKKIPPENP